MIGRSVRRLVGLPLHWQILLGVALAAAIGVTLNITASSYRTPEPVPIGKGEHLVAIDTVDRIDIHITDAGGQTLRGNDGRLRAYVIDPTGETEGSYLTLEELKRKQPRVYRQFVLHGRSTARITGDAGHAVGQLFLRMLKMVAVPLIIFSLMTGVLGLADAGRLRRLFGLTVTYYVATSMLAILTGLVLVNTIRPGVREVQLQGRAQEVEVGDDLGTTLFQQVERLIPENPFQAVVQSEFLSIIAFTLAFGVFTILVGGKTLETFRGFFEAGFEVMMRMTMAIIYLAPIGVFALMLYATATQGLDVFQRLGWYLLTVFLALLIHSTVTLPLIVWLAARRNPLEYARAMSPALLTAFSSASSNATLPLTMSCVEERAGVDNRIGSFVLPLGATVNMDGTALFEVIAVLFIAQLTPGVDLTVGQQFLVAVTALLASIGAAGIPSAGLVMMIIVLQAVNLPTDRVALILAVDRILDMCRTSVNVWSDACGCAVVARLDAGDLRGQAQLPTHPQPATTGGQT